MNNARKAILDRLNQLQYVGNEDDAIHKTDSDPVNWDLNKKVSRFVSRMQAVHAEVHEASETTWLDKLQEICQIKKVRTLLVSTSTLRGVAIHAQAERFPELRDYRQPIESWKEELFNGIDAAVTGAYAGIAETGTIILWSGEQEPRTMSLVPPVHIVILEKAVLYSTFSEVMRLRNWAHSGLPANVILISGPSKSADIEQTMTYGVHGPKELIVILV